MAREVAEGRGRQDQSVRISWVSDNDGQRRQAHCHQVTCPGGTASIWVPISSSSSGRFELHVPLLQLSGVHPELTRLGRAPLSDPLQLRFITDRQVDDLSTDMQRTAIQRSAERSSSLQRPKSRTTLRPSWAARIPTSISLPSIRSRWSARSFDRHRVGLSPSNSVICQSSGVSLSADSLPSSSFARVVFPAPGRPTMR